MVDGLLLDIDGVLVVSWDPLPGASEAVAAVRAAGLPLRFLTNTTSQTSAEIVRRLRSGGFEVSEDEVLTSTAATAAYLREHHSGARCLLVNSGDVEADLEGVDLVGPGIEPEDVDVVLLGGAGPEFDYATLNSALACLIAGADLIAMHRNLAWRTADGLQLDTGAFLLGLEQAADVEATIIGKPAAAMFQGGLDTLGIAAADAVMVGDDIATDVRAAMDLGITGVQVRTGKFRPDQLDRGPEPDAVLDSIADLPEWLDLT